MHDDDLEQLRDGLAALRTTADQILEQAKLTNGRITKIEDEWWGPTDPRAARTSQGWLERVQEMYSEHRDRAAVMRAVKWLATFVGFQTVALTAYGVAQILGGGGVP